MLLPNYQPHEHEKTVYASWLQAKLGSPEAQILAQNPSNSKTHAILMPPPNLTGNMHAGHAFQHFLMDSLSRYNRMQGKVNLWYPGVDHAGIQLEGVIDKLIKNGEFDEILKEDSVTLWQQLQQIPCEQWAQFIKKNNPELWQKLAWSKVNAWRDNQKNQAAVLGDTPDYDRQLFTLDDRANAMVMHAFKKYWEDGLLYKSSYLINWSVALQTALSDVSGEIEYEKKVDPFITFEYRPVAFNLQTDKEHIPLLAKLHDYFDNNPIRVSTVRPETIFGDVAVAIHPQRLTDNLQKAGFNLHEIAHAKHLIKTDQLGMQLGIKPLEIGNIRLIIAEEVDNNFGTGALKITPASDITDYELFNKYLGGEIPHAIGRDGCLTNICGSYAGLTREDARVLVIKKLLETGFVPMKDVVDSVDENKSSEHSSTEEFEDFESLKTTEQKYNWLAKKYSNHEANWNYEHNVSVCERSKTVIEPLISEEFFVSFSQPAASTQKTLQQHGLEGVSQTTFYTPEYAQRATNFLENIHDWCISRNLIWGHRIPVWYNVNVNPEKKFYTFKELLDNNFTQLALKVQPHMPTEPGNWVQEEKILDTWFSSCLWPLSTLGFYDEYEKVLNPKSDTDFSKQLTDFAQFYSTQEMTTAKEIFYLWIVRMIVLGKYFTSQLPKNHPQYNKIPFESVIITPTILDEKGRKMSKSLGNGLDPVLQINKYSSDSLRMAMLSGMIPNRNMKMGGQLADRICEKYRNFGNKLWNIARFLEYKQTELNLQNPKEGEVFDNLSEASLWILQSFIALQQSINQAFESYELGRAIEDMYHFVWDEFADWYVEYLKTDPSQIVFASKLFTQIISLISPLFPHETEVLWQQFCKQNTTLAFAIYNANWAQKTLDLVKNPPSLTTQNRVDNFVTVIDFIRSIRSARGLFGIDPAVAFEVFTQSSLLHTYADFIRLAAKCTVISDARENLYTVVSAKYQYSVDILSYISNVSEEILRTEKNITSLTKQIDQLQNQLGNPKFLQHAEAEAVTEKRENLANRETEIHQQKEKLAFLLKSGAGA